MSCGSSGSKSGSGSNSSGSSGSRSTSCGSCGSSASCRPCGGCRSCGNGNQSRSYSDSKGPSKGDEWTYNLWFDSEADKTTERKFRCITVDKLSTEVQGPASAIKNVFVYETPHPWHWPWLDSPWHQPWRDSLWDRFGVRPDRRQISDTGHLFVVLKDELGSYWSIDKSDKGLTIQKGRNLNIVINLCKWEKRRGTSKRVKEIIPKATTSVSDVIHWIQDRVVPQLHEELKPAESFPNCYEFIASVCEHFETRPLAGILKPNNNCCAGWKEVDKCGKYLFHYIPEVDVNYKSWITADELVHKVGDDCFDAQEPIISATTYKTPISAWQLTYQVFYHLNVVLKTRSWYWSIEKNSEGLTIQRSKKIEAVRDRYRQEARPSGWRKVKAVNSAMGTMTVRQLITWLQEKKWLDRKYHAMRSNCKHFGNDVYNYVTNNNKYPLDLPSTS